ncbi:MAG: 2-dehydropantoate 2-reductase N-terminal domain-containing protein, partial [Rhodospirillales bacterium]|nr:2-dehydropantoate 2-reductase N-terminal domain-containing protein [Rhodospirillales bacterium]
MRIAIVGAGAMGSLFGGYLAGAGADVTLVDVNKAHIDAINAEGLSLDTGDGPRRIEVKATTEPASAGIVDLIVVFCKYRQTSEAMNAARPMMSPETYVWTLQNG